LTEQLPVVVAVSIVFLPLKGRDLLICLCRFLNYCLPGWWCRLTWEGQQWQLSRLVIVVATRDSLSSLRTHPRRVSAPRCGRGRSWSTISRSLASPCRGRGRRIRSVDPIRMQSRCRLRFLIPSQRMTVR